MENQKKGKPSTKFIRLVAAFIVVVLVFCGIYYFIDYNSPEQKVKRMVANMTLEEKIGQMMLINFRNWKTAAMENPAPMEVLNDDIASLIGQYHIGNIILFGENTQNTEKTVRLTAALQKAALHDGNLPLLIGIDQEGGMVTRLGQGTCLPGNMALGATRNLTYAFDSGQIIGQELSVLGIHCTFAPDADVNDNPDNPVINLRSFGEDPELVQAMVVQMKDGIKGENVIACIKHFPGHGNTATDTHTGISIVEKTKEQWNICEKIPFAQAIKSGVDMVMTAHIQYPHLDDTQVVSAKDHQNMYLPATLSEKIVTGILRKELGFNGVIVTDAMDMQAITEHFGETEAIVMAMNAGVDLICNPTEITCMEDVTKLDAIYEAIKEAVNQNQISMTRMDEAVTRILTLKMERGILETQQYETPVDEKVSMALATVGCKAHHDKEREMANAAITLYGSSTNSPFSPQQGDTILFVMPYENELYSVTYAANRMMAEATLPDINLDTFCYENQETMSNALIAKINAADYIVLGSEMYGVTKNDPTHWLNVMPTAITRHIQTIGKTKQTGIISLALPYDAVQYPDFPVFIAYNAQGMSKKDAESGVLTAKYGPNLPAAIDAMFGAFEPKGVLPVTIS